MSNGGCDNTAGNGGFGVSGGLFNFDDIIEINAAKLIAEDGGTVFRVVDSGIPADYTITLPASPADGDAYGFMFDVASTKLFTIDGNGKTLNGNKPSYPFWSGESIFIRYDDTLGYWVRLSGTDIPMEWEAILLNEVLQNSSVFVTVPFDSEDSDNAGIFNLGLISPRRDNKFEINVTTSVRSDNGTLNRVVANIFNNTTGNAKYTLLDDSPVAPQGAGYAAGNSIAVKLLSSTVYAVKILGITSSGAANSVVLIGIVAPEDRRTFCSGKEQIIW